MGKKNQNENKKRINKKATQKQKKKGNKQQLSWTYVLKKIAPYISSVNNIIEYGEKIWPIVEDFIHKLETVLSHLTS